MVRELSESTEETLGPASLCSRDHETEMMTGCVKTRTVLAALLPYHTAVVGGDQYAWLEGLLVAPEMAEASVPSQKRWEH